MSVLDVLTDTFLPTRHHRVRLPENLSTLSVCYYGTPNHAMDIFQANRSILSDPDAIYPGMVLVIPHITHPRKHG